MRTFQTLNARVNTIEELLSYDEGRHRERDVVRQAILDTRHNVLLFGSRGSGKTFFQRTQAHYFMQNDSSVLSIFAPCSVDRETDGLDILTMLLLGWWERRFGVTKGQLLRASTSSDGPSIIDGSAKKKLVELYRLVQAAEIGRAEQRTSQYGASAVVSAKNSVASTESTKRRQLRLSEIRTILEEFAQLVSDSTCRKLIVHLDEAELLSPADTTAVLDFYLNLFNPVGIQFVATAAPISPKHKALLGEAVETSVELEGLDDAECLSQMIQKYAFGGGKPVSSVAVDVLYEFFKGHPRYSLSCCARAVELSPLSDSEVGAKAMAKACVEGQARRQALQAILPKSAD